MLVLTRKIGETIRIGDEIEITVTRFERNGVRLAFKAPVDIRIYRGEIYRDIYAAEQAKPGGTSSVPPLHP